MTDKGEFIDREIVPTLGEFSDDYDCDVIVDGCMDAGLVGFDFRDGYVWTEKGRRDATEAIGKRYWAVVESCERR